MLHILGPYGMELTQNTEAYTIAQYREGAHMYGQPRA